jgi:hypothetical protein
LIDVYCFGQLLYELVYISISDVWVNWCLLFRTVALRVGVRLYFRHVSWLMSTALDSCYTSWCTFLLQTCELIDVYCFGQLLYELVYVSISDVWVDWCLLFRTVVIRVGVHFYFRRVSWLMSTVSDSCYTSWCMVNNSSLPHVIHSLHHLHQKSVSCTRFNRNVRENQVREPVTTQWSQTYGSERCKNIYSSQDLFVKKNITHALLILYYADGWNGVQEVF